jgi:hypothetical protein
MNSDPHSNPAHPASSQPKSPAHAAPIPERSNHGGHVFGPMGGFRPNQPNRSFHGSGGAHVAREHGRGRHG